MAYQITQKSILKDSDGKTILITDGQIFAELVNSSNTQFDLNPTYISNLFFQFAGSTSGYTSSASGPSDPAATIDKFPFSADANATDVGDLTATVKGAAGASSTTHGYVAGGYSWDIGARTNAIEKFSFSVDGNATDVGDLTQARRDGGGVMSQTHGYAVTGNAPPNSNVIDKYPFASDANATDVGNTTTSRGDNNSGSQSPTHGYQAGGTSSNVIDKFPFAADGDATDVGDLTDTQYGKSGQFSESNGYATRATAIEKYPYASDANAVSVGTIAGARHYSAGQSSTTHGYVSGGTPGSSNEIDKFPFAISSGQATDVGDLTQGRSQNAGNQV